MVQLLSFSPCSVAICLYFEFFFFFEAVRVSTKNKTTFLATRGSFFSRVANSIMTTVRHWYEYRHRGACGWTLLTCDQFKWETGTPLYQMPYSTMGLLFHRTFSVAPAVEQDEVLCRCGEVVGAIRSNVRDELFIRFDAYKIRPRYLHTNTAEEADRIFLWPFDQRQLRAAYQPWLRRLSHEEFSDCNADI